ncbi:serine hydrolase [Microbacterium sp. MYb64]|uniref:serine hydrolase domain-containing protein n=1 Tax=Microbacterium sp. MYb64 TaxID=1848691 RepID=UPI000CFAF90A|nr:serine hydrolase domain-containing protein [Microbacterium sp. MYb64]PRB07862.1 hypothetical protein CQ044_04020 [Microbacterium sp. MYb64]
MVITEKRISELDATLARVVEESGAPAAQYALAMNGGVVHAGALGHADADSRFCIFSASKPVFASLILHLSSAGTLDLGSRVADLWPEFAAGGKHDVTIEQLLLFTAGIPSCWPARDSAIDPARRAAELAAASLETAPGTAYAYHPVSAHWVLAEIVRRTTGLDHREALRHLILDPLGLDRMQLGVPLSAQHGIEPAELVGAYDLAFAEATLGQPLTSAQLDAVNALALGIGRDPALIAAGVPGGGVISDASSLALFYQALLHGRPALWDDDVLNSATRESRNVLADEGRGGAPANRTVGCLTIAGEGVPYAELPALGLRLPVRHHGTRTSARTFGHPGFGGQLGFADPDYGYSFAFLISGAERDGIAGARRDREIADAVAGVFSG